MSPIRPALGSVHARAPEPQATRPLRCPACGHAFALSRRAISARCPRCTSPLRLEDLTIHRDQQSAVDTLGHVRIADRSSLTGELTCGQLTNGGRFVGQAMVHGSIELLVDSYTSGGLRGRSLRVVLGATLRGRVVISPHTALPPTPAERAARRVRVALAPAQAV